jgi:hypothetical protein
MAGPTDVLTEDVKDLRTANRELASELREANRELASEIKDIFKSLSAELRESNHRLTESINGVARDLGNFRVEVAKDLGVINTNLEKSATSLKYVGRGVTILIPVVIALIGAAIGISWYAGKLDSRVQQVESRLDKAPAK